MPNSPLSLPLSQIIAHDAPLLSPIAMHDQHWDAHPALFASDFSFNYYALPSPPHSIGSSSNDSPIQVARVLRHATAADADPDQQLCLPTHQLFDFPHSPVSPSPAPSSPNDRVRPSISINTQVASAPSLPSATNSHDSCSAAAKRSASPTPSVPRKRTIGERISSKDFVPPDVSGLSKREARLVKNRAAAFLSRQRKREEFECMEVRVSELEQENARLLALTQKGSPASQPQSDSQLVSQVELLRLQLAEAKQRERELSEKLANAADPPIKVETSDAQFSLSSSPPRSSSITSPHKSGASLGLMVLLCALPTLLSMPMHSSAPTSFSIPNPFPPSSASSFDFNSFVPNDYDWSRSASTSMMDMDSSDSRSKYASTPYSGSSSTTRTLQLSADATNDFGGLSGLDISFDASPSDDGKIRVRIHPSSSASSRSTSPGATYSSSNSEPSSSPSLGMWSGSEPEPSFASAFATNGHSNLVGFPTSMSSNDDPFLGIGASNTYGMHYSPDGSAMMYGQMNELSSALEYDNLSDTAFSLGSEPESSSGNKRRVRIALKSMPAAGGEGGEWEVQIC